uniref:LRR binding FLII interacting protein 1 n=1 Tax=Oryzias sinensis TaxID=183150 RepID=A0A8C7Y203_9TELE
MTDMGTQGTGRKRSTKKERATAEDEALNLIAREAEARLAAKRAARAEAREIRMKELERQQKEVHNRPHTHTHTHTQVPPQSTEGRTFNPARNRIENRSKEVFHSGSLTFLSQGCRAPSSLTAATLTSLGGTSSRRGSGETALTVDADSSIREIKEIHELKDQIQDVETKYMQNLKEVKDSLAEVEEKYRKAMVSNAQLDNEKSNLMYEVDTLKDSLMELEELLSESRRQYEDKAKDYERAKHAHSVLQFQFNEMKESLKQSEELLNEIRQLRIKQDSFVREVSDLQETVEWKDKKIGALERQKEYTDAIRTERDELREEVVKLKDVLKKHGIVLGPDLNVNGEAEDDESSDAAPRPALDSQGRPAEGNNILGKADPGVFYLPEIRLRKLVDEREKMIEQVKKLKAQLDQKTQKSNTDGGLSPDGEIFENGNDPNIMDLQRDSSRQINDLKFKLVKAEQDVTALEQNVTRLEGHVTRYKSLAENAEKVEDELKAEKRKLQRELRSALDKIEELESSNSHLNKRLEKMKSSRGLAPTP